MRVSAPTLQRLSNPSGDLQRFIFSEALTRLQERNPLAQQVLQALTFFDLDSGATKEALAATVGAPVEQALKQLLNLNLFNRHQSGKRFTMLPLTRDFAQQEITPEWEREARERWSEFFLRFARRHLVDEAQERYWNTLGSRDAKPLDPEIRNLLNVLAWAEKQGHGLILIDIMMTLVHYLDKRMLFAERLHYARKAAEAAHKLGQEVNEGLLRIDALGWTLTEVGRLTEGEREIITGLQIAKSIGPESTAANNLIGLAYAWLAKVYLNQHDYEGASSMINKAMSIDCEPVIRGRIYMAAGDLAHTKQNDLEAVKLYKEGVHLTWEYGGESQAVDMRHRLGFAYLGAGNLKQAEIEFNSVAQQGISTEGLYAIFGLARIAHTKGQSDSAKEMAQEVFDKLSRLVPNHRLLKEIADFLRELDEN